MDFEQRLAAARRRERWVAAYRDSPEVFRSFEAAEDRDGLAAGRLAALAGLGCGGSVARVLELGAGTGWLTRRLAPLVEEYVVVEPSPEMLRAGREAGHFEGARLVRGRGERLPVASGSVSHVVASFVLLDLRPELRRQVLAEVQRVLAPTPGAAFWVIENHGTGEYQRLRGIEDTAGGLGESRPLVDELGFEKLEVVETELAFESAEQASGVLGAILGDAVRNGPRREPCSRIGLDLVILRNTVTDTLLRSNRTSVPHTLEGPLRPT